jgi:NAD(P)H-dependent flavin oxidoreductase YrpB (nitropropane dioxygenase family)
VGTRFVTSDEEGATRAHKAAVLSAEHGDIARTLIYTGRPLRVRRTPYVDGWEQNRQAEIRELTAKGHHPESSRDGEAPGGVGPGGHVHDGQRRGADRLLFRSPLPLTVAR